MENTLIFDENASAVATALLFVSIVKLQRQLPQVPVQEASLLHEE